MVENVFSLPFPFCQAVYQDRLRNDVKKIIAVATVPFLKSDSTDRFSASLFTFLKAI